MCLVLCAWFSGLKWRGWSKQCREINEEPINKQQTTKNEEPRTPPFIPQPPPKPPTSLPTQNKAPSTRARPRSLHSRPQPHQRTLQHKSMPIQRFEEIEGWQLARELCRSVYDAAQCGSFARDFGLRDQINRSSGSIMDNIAEGFDGGSNAEFARFLSYAQRSCSEVRSQLYRALDRSHIDQATFDRLSKQTVHVRGKIGAFIKYLKNHPRSKPNR